MATKTKTTETKKGYSCPYCGGGPYKYKRYLRDHWTRSCRKLAVDFGNDSFTPVPAPAPKTKNRASAPDMMSWQYQNLLAALSQVTLHAQDDSCPCNQVHLGDDGKYHAEYCIGKHLLEFWSLALETGLMDEANREMLESMAVEANEFLEKAKEIYCEGGAWPDLAQWARDCRKKLEPLFFACSTSKGKKTPAPAPIVEVISEKEPQPELEVTIAPPEPELGVEVDVVAPAPAPSGRTFRGLLMVAHRAGDDIDKHTELNLAQRNFIKAFQHAGWDRRRFVGAVQNLPFSDDRINYMEDVAAGKASKDGLLPSEAVLVEHMAPMYSKPYDFGSALYDLTLTDPEHWKAGDPDFPAPSPAEKAQVCADMREGEFNHKHFLGVPEHPKTGNHDWHRRWVGIYQNAQRVIGCDCKRS